MKALFLFPVLLCFSLFGWAQEPVQKDSVTRLEEVVLMDSVRIKNAIGIVPSRVIGPEVFQNYSPIDAVSAINQIPGVYILSGALNTNRITIRGVGARTPFGTDKLRLYFNDIPVTNGTGFSTIEAFDLENLAAIEVIKGPKGVAFGTNLGGAIILDSRERKEESTEFRNNFTVGSYALLKNNLAFLHKEEKLSLGFHYGHMETEGYRENNRFERDGFLLNTSLKINKKNMVSLLVNHIDYTAQIPSSLSQTAFDEDPTQAAFTWAASQGFETNNYTLLGLSLNHRFSDKFENTTGIFYTYLDHFEPRPFNILDEFTNGFGFRTRFSGSFNLGRQNIQYTFGGELYKDEYHWGTFENLYQENNGNGSLQGDRLSDNREFRRQFNGFGALTVPLTPRFMAQAGLNINKTKYDFRDLFNSGAQNTSAERDFDVIIMPSLNLDYAFASGQKVYANISRGFSNPSLEETLTPDGVINPDIAQETGTNYEVGTFLSLANRKLTIDAALYRMDIKNLLVAQRVGDDQFVGRNAGQTKHQGLDLEMNYDWEISRKLRISPFVNYTFSDHSFVDFVDGENDFSGNPLTGVPKHRINSGLRFQWGAGFYWNTTHQFVDEISLRDEDTVYSDSFNVFNSRLGYRTTLFQKLTLGLDFGMNNIANTKYAQSVLINAGSFGGNEPRYFYPGNDRNVYGGIRLGYFL